MIYSDVTITVKGNTATLDNDLYLYKNDKNITINISIVNSIWNFAKKLENNIIEKTEATFFTLRWMKGDKVKKVFEDQQIKKGKCEFVITEELIDEDIEMGDYDFQISLLDEEKNSILSIPPVIEQIHINKHIFEDEDINTVGNAKVGIAKVGTYEQRSTENSEGLYNKKTWQDNEVITKEDLNTIEEGIYNNSTQCKDIANKIDSGNLGNNVEPALMDMPRIYFSEGTLPTTKTATMMKFDYYSKTTEYHGWAEIKCQGNSSMSYAKKNFTIKLYKDKEKTEKLKIDFKNWGKQSKFVLKANWIDLTHARNVVSARIWGDIVKSRSGYANLPELLRTSPNQGAIDGFPIVVYGNGYYQGRYTLNIPKDKWMSNMDDTLDTHCILCSENYVSGCFRATANINGNDWTDELHDVVPASIKTRWNQCISFVMNSTDEEFKTNLSNYFDVESLIDYLLFGIISCGLDAFGKNQIYFTYDGQKWIASMYDMDSTWGLWWNGNSFVATDYPRESFEDFNGSGREGNLLYIRLQQLFIDEIKARYAELKQTIFTYPYLVNKFEEFVQICPLDIVKEDYASTTANGAYTGIPSKTTNNIQQIRNYIKARLDYCDSYINSLVVPIPCTGITLNANEIVFENTTATQTLTATLTPTNTTDSVVWSVSPEGIATVENGVVTPVSNGSCIITATCGNQTATCNVAVNLPNVSVTALSLDKDSITLGDTIDTSNVNLLEGVNSSIDGKGNVVFDSITLNSGVYVFKNINGGTFTWLGGNYDDIKYETNNSTSQIAFNLNSSKVVQFHAYTNNNDTNTSDKLGLFKLGKAINSMDNPMKFTVAGKGYYRGNSLVASDTDEYSNTVTLDSSKKYLLMNEGDTRIDKNLVTWLDNNNISGSAGYKINAHYPIYLFENISSLSVAINTSNNTLSDLALYEVSAFQNLEDTLTATLTPSNATNQNVTWSSSNPSVVTVEGNGLSATVNGVSSGNAIITCTSQDTTNGTISDTCNVTVTDVPTE